MGVMYFTYAGDPLFHTMFLDTERVKKYGSGARAGKICSPDARDVWILSLC